MPARVRLNPCQNPRPTALLLAALAVSLGLAPGCIAPPTSGGPSAEARPADTAPTWASLQARAIEQATRGAQSDNPRIRANALEALTPVPEVAAPLLASGAQDHKAVVRFAALVTAGRARVQVVGPIAERLATEDPDPSVRAAAIYAARKVGIAAPLREIPALLADPRPGVRSNVASIVGLLGKKSAVAMLDRMRRAPMPSADLIEAVQTDLQFAGSIYRLSGSPGALEFIRSAVYLRDNDPARVLAIQMLGRLGDRAFESNLNNLMDPDNEPIQVRLAAAEALARLGDPGAGMHVVLEAGQYDAVAVRRDLKAYLDTPVIPADAAPAPPPGQDLTEADRAAIERLRLEQQRAEAAEQRRREADRSLLNDTATHERLAAGVRAQAGSILGLFNHELTREVADRLLSDNDPRVRLAASAGVLLYGDPATAR
ncbi:MAG: hypothetical protein AAGA57_04290 [Planctomycetota bacterium]